MSTRSILTIVFAVGLAVVGAVFVRSLSPPESPTGSLAFLSVAPSLPIYDRAGKAVDLSKEKGRLIIIHFWATWCPPCVEEVPALSKFWEKYRGRNDLVLYTISVDKDWKTIDDFTAKNPNTLPTYRDPNATTAKRFGWQSPDLHREQERPRHHRCRAPSTGTTRPSSSRSSSC
jgi:thiol-disulfide isomerase/thioredoxin